MVRLQLDANVGNLPVATLNYYFGNHVLHTGGSGSGDEESASVHFSSDEDEVTGSSADGGGGADGGADGAGGRGRRRLVIDVLAQVFRSAAGAGRGIIAAEGFRPSSALCHG